jgi:hypothetical protein
MVASSDGWQVKLEELKECLSVDLGQANHRWMELS